MTEKKKKFFKLFTIKSKLRSNCKINAKVIVRAEIFSPHRQLAPCRFFSLFVADNVFMYNFVMDIL